MNTVVTKTPKVLIVEDEKSIRTTLGFFLESLGLRYLSAADGKEATQLLAEHDIGILITDFQMPNMDGIELLQWCREHDFHFPVIFITANADLAPREKIALEDCCATLMRKPINLDGLERALAAAQSRDHHADCVHARRTPL